MEIFTGFLIAVALAMDAFSVSITAGSGTRKLMFRQALLIAGYFGFFQFFMTGLGWLGGSLFSEVINSFDHWIAFGLLLVIGGKMVIESFRKQQREQFSFNHKVLLVLAIATSIDALGVGLSYSLLNKPILVTSIIIGAVAFGFSYTGVYLGKMLQKIFQNKMELVGGIILIGIGFKIAIEHGAFWLT
jgi:putative Mn2+ efflux pump MntP